MTLFLEITGMQYTEIISKKVIGGSIDIVFFPRQNGMMKNSSSRVYAPFL